MNKKGYVFALDVIIAAVILIVGVAMMFYTFTPAKQPYYFTDQLSSDVISVLAATKVADVCFNPGPYPGCICPRYPSLEVVACTGTNTIDPDILSLISEHIERGSIQGPAIEDLIHEIFVVNNVIDEKRFGFAVLYMGNAGNLLELYNTNTYGVP